MDSMSDEHSENSEEADGFCIEDTSDTIPLDKAESKLLFSDDGVLAGLEGRWLPLDDTTELASLKTPATIMPVIILITKA